MMIFLLLPFLLLADTSPFRWSEKGIPSEIPVDYPSSSEIHEEFFYESIQRGYDLHKDVIGNNQKPFSLGIIEWKTPYISAWAWEGKEGFTINFWGGFARLDAMTKRSFVLTICHEIGHTIGREPTHTLRATTPLMSSEGQADYFAANSCFKKYHRFYPFPKNVAIPPELASKCYLKFLDQDDREACLQTIQAVIDDSHVLSFLAQQPPAQFDTPSPLIVSETIRDGYPDIQCRLDTGIQAALQGERPRCWFATE